MPSRGVNSAARRPAARKRRNQGNWEIRKKESENDPGIKKWAICGAEAPLEAAGDIRYCEFRAIRVASHPQARDWKIKI